MNSRLKNLAALTPHPAARPPERKCSTNHLADYHPKFTTLWVGLQANKPHGGKQPCIGIGSKGILSPDADV